MSLTPKSDLRKSVSSLLSEVADGPKSRLKAVGDLSTDRTVLKKGLSGTSTVRTPKAEGKQLTRKDSTNDMATDSPRKKYTLTRENSSKALLISQAGGEVKLRKHISRSSSAVGDGGSGASEVLNNFVDEVLVASPTASLARQKSQHSTNAVNLSFDDQINSYLVNELPYVSKAKQMKSVWPTHTSERRYRIIDISKRLKRNDGGLVRLRLNSEHVDDNLLALVCDGLSGNTTLQYLMLLNNMITDEGVKRLSKAARRHPSLHTVWLGGNMISDQGVYHLEGLLRRNKTIRELNLSNKWPELRWEKTEHKNHPRVTDNGASMLARLLAESAPGGGLFNLCLSEQRIGDKGATALFSAVPRCSLRTLSLSGNELTDVCCSALRVLLTEESNLEYLNLSHNNLTDKGVAIFAPALCHNVALHALDLSYNQIGRPGMTDLLERLCSNSTMQSISLRCNLCEDDSVEKFLKTRMLQRLECHMVEDRRAFAAYGVRDDGRDFYERNLEAFEKSQTEAFRRVGKGNVAMKLIDDLTSSLGAFGKPLPARAVRVGSPAQANPFQRSDSRGSSRGGPHIALTRSHSTDMNSFGRGESFHSDAMSSDNDDEDPDIFDSDWEARSCSTSVAPGTRGLPPIADGDEDVDDDISDIKKNRHPEPFLDAQSLSYCNARQVGVGRAEDHMEVLVTSPVKPSAALGKTRGIPHIGSYVGSQPIRSATYRHRDSGNHLMYLRVLTPADPPGTKPYPVVKIGRDRLETRQKEVEARQTALHKQQKRNALLYNKVFGLKEALEALPPPKFWKEWTMQVDNKYPTGIDRAPGCTSVGTLIVKEDREKLEQSKLMTRRRQMAQEYGFKQTKKVGTVDVALPALEIQQSHSHSSSELRAIVPPTNISAKYKDEASAVGVGEHYRRTHVNVTSKSDAQRRAQEINVETLLGLAVTEKVSSVVTDPNAPKHLTLAVHNK